MDRYTIGGIGYKPMEEREDKVKDTANHCKQSHALIDSTFKITLRSMSVVDQTRLKDLIQSMFEVTEIQKVKVEYPFYARRDSHQDEIDDAKNGHP